ncbi:MAG: type II CAAX endopeptidase family protein [Bacteroidetes bacterium]|nr:type II CAAX endopeptidase family protein [Bacteroidota bacterium]
MPTPKPDLLSYLSPFSKLLFLLLIIFTTLMITVLLGVLIGMPFFGQSFSSMLQPVDIKDPNYLPLLKYLQILSQLGIFIFPPLIFAYLISKKAPEYLLINKKPDVVTLILACSLMVLSMPFTSWLLEINQHMALPSFLQQLESWLQIKEDQADVLTKTFLSTKSLSGFLVNLLMIGILPSVGEEFLFRSVMIRLFREWTGNIHWAVVLSAILFSSMHMQFYGFIPRVVLGLFLGYLFAWSGNLWVPVLAHFMNNGLAVIAAFLYTRGLSRFDVETLGTQPAFWEVGISIVLVISLLWLIFQRQKKLRVNG